MRRICVLLLVNLLFFKGLFAMYSGGSGTEADPYQISNMADLHQLSQNTSAWSKHIILTCDIDAAETSDITSSYYNFSPIGDATNGSRQKISFVGHFNGNGFNIFNLYINREESFIGLFGMVKAGAVIEKVGIINAKIIQPGVKYAAGGLVGYALGGVADSVFISQCVVMGGKLEGYNAVGGIAGVINRTTLINSYANINVKGNDLVSSLVGRIGSDTKNKIKYCYALGDCSGKSRVAGISGINETGITVAFNCYYNQQLGNTTKGIASGTSTGTFNLTTTQFADSANFVDWKFNQVWHMKSHNSPRLIWQKGSKGWPLITDIQVLGRGEITPFSTVVGYNNQQFLFEANPAKGWSFKEWTNNGTQYPTDTLLTLILTADTIFQANFIPDTNNFTFKTEGNGHISVDTGMVRYPSGDFSFTAYPDAGYKLQTWIYKDTVYSTENNINLTIDGDATLKAIFVVDTTMKTITVTKFGNGTILPDDTLSIKIEDNLTIVAVPNEGWHFVKWIVSGGADPIIYYDSTLTFKVLHDYSVEAIFTSLKGKGTKVEPYQIGSMDDLHHLSSNFHLWNLNTFFLLIADIDASKTSDSTSIFNNNGKGFSPIGNTTSSFKGTIFGKNHVISNLYIKAESAENVGLFGRCNDNIFWNIGLENASISGKSYVGALIGSATNSTVTNCYATGSVKGSNRNLGGLIGCLYAGSLSESYFNGSVGSVSEGERYIGGLVGYLHGNCKVSDCYSHATVIGVSQVGGLIGYKDGSPIVSNCYSSGITSGISSIGQFIGNNASSNSDHLSNCYGLYRTGQEVFDGEQDLVKGLTMAEMKQGSNFTNWNLKSIWRIRTDSTFPALLRVNNAPFAFADTVQGTLKDIMTKNFDYETYQSKLVYHYTSMFVIQDSAEWVQTPDSISVGDSVLVTYQIGELKDDNTTLWGRSVTSLLIVAENQAPVIGSTAVTSAFEDSVYTYQLLAADADADPLVYSLTHAPAGMELIGTTLFWTPKGRYNTSQTVTVKVTDGLATTTQSFTILISHLNTAPTVVAAIEDKVESEGFSTTILNLTSVFTDAENDPLVYTATSSNNNVLNVYANNNELVITEVGVGTATITVTAVDFFGAAISDAFELKVNAAPTVINEMADTLVNEGFSEISIDISSVFTDANGDALIYEAVSANINVASVVLSNLVLKVSEVGIGSTEITLTASDEHGSSVSQAFLFTVNGLPVITDSIANQTETEGFESLTIDLSSVFSDPDSDLLTYSAESSNAQVVTVAVNSGILTITEVGYGNSTIKVAANDGKGGAISDEFAITVDKKTGINNAEHCEVKVYPNPALTEIKLTGYSGLATTTVYNNNGTEVLIQAVEADKSIEISMLSQGMYWVKTVTNSGSFVNKLIIE